MSGRPFRKRVPRNRNNRFQWMRLVCADTGVVHWRLFRRAESGAWHMGAVGANPGEPRAAIASRLAWARRELLDRVDDIELQALGVLP